MVRQREHELLALSGPATPPTRAPCAETSLIRPARAGPPPLSTMQAASTACRSARRRSASEIELRTAGHDAALQDAHVAIDRPGGRVHAAGALPGFAGGVRHAAGLLADRRTSAPLWATLRAISCVTADCSSIAAAIAPAASAMSEIMPSMPFTAETTADVLDWISVIWRLISSVLRAVWFASAFTSPATTRSPCRPHRRAPPRSSR